MKLKNLLEPSINDLGYNLVGLSISDDNGKVLRIIIERKDLESVSLSDCQKVSKSLSPILDVEDLIRDSYRLEVSSPGIEDSRDNFDDWENSIGSEVLIILHKSLNKKQKRLRGILKETNGNFIIIEFILRLRTTERLIF